MNEFKTLAIKNEREKSFMFSKYTLKICFISFVCVYVLSQVFILNHFVIRPLYFPPKITL